MFFRGLTVAPHQPSSNCSMTHNPIRVENATADSPIQLEVIASTLKDALAAWEGGATRLELAVNVEQGGTTPPVALVESIAQRVPLPLRIILRDNETFQLTGSAELAGLKHKAKAFADIGINGLVTGHVKDGALDLETLEEIISCVPAMDFTVHHVLEQTANPVDSLISLRLFPNVDKALIRGGNGTLLERMSRIMACARAFGNGRAVIVGGDVTLEMLEPLQRGTQIREFHLGRAVRTLEHASAPVDVRKVQRACNILSALGDLASAGSGR